METLVVRYSEIALKGHNRRQFERRMAENLACHVKALGPYTVTRQHLRAEIDARADRATAADLAPGADLAAAADLVRGLPGVANVSVARHVPRAPERLAESARALVAEVLARPGAPGRPRTFRIEVARKDKRYPLTSMQLAAELGGAVLEAFPELRVDLTRPDLTVMIEVGERDALLFEEKIPGPGGLAVGSSGRVLCLLSGGIDSPVAAYLMMTRGCEVAYLYFHSFPFIGENSKEKVLDLVRFMARFQPRSRLIVAPFAEAQQAIRDLCPEALRTVLYRRTMNRVAVRVAERVRAQALVTGESLGQVASQTLENIAAIRETASLPLFQPLIGLNKQEIVERARRIGTYPISIRPFPDCCTLFQPRHPETRARPEQVHEAEAKLPLAALVEQCLAGLETIEHGPEYYPAHW